ncbi:MAG: excinuclease ABC subunit B, partial [Candidatus Moranbacteria bacterium]|nr:excinuclease ABC subunit B [Candidatus Moranbacteria bacterium]
TGSLERALSETNRRRALQIAYNRKHKITPQTIIKKIGSIVDHELRPEMPQETLIFDTQKELKSHIQQREKDMKNASKKLDFEQALLIRDEITQLRKLVE